MSRRSSARTDQFAYIALEYSKFLIASREPKSGAKDERKIVHFPVQLGTIADSDDSATAATKIEGLRKLHEVLARIIKSPAAGKDEKLKLLWVMGRYGEIKAGSSISISNDRLKQYAWSTSKGQRVFNQVRDFGVIGEYDDEDPFATIRFESDSDDGFVAQSLQQYVADLVSKFGEDGLDMFKKADMTLYS